MMAKLSQCFRCGSREIEGRPVEELIRRGRYVVALRVPANVCFDCGEQYFAKDQVEMFEDVRKVGARADAGRSRPGCKAREGSHADLHSVRRETGDFRRAG
jgi:YgiT-type zinc finger domain-containing protein